MARFKDTDWNLDEHNPGWNGAQLAVLMDIRDELKRLNALLRCHNFQDIPFKLDRIVEATRRTDKRLAKQVKL